MNDANRWKTYVYAAFFLAIAILLQSIRLIIPMVPGPVNMFLIGSLVNMTLLLAAIYTKNPRMALLGLILPLVAFMQGNLPVVFMVPIVGLGNVLYTLLGYYLWQNRWVWIAAVAKAVFLAIGTKLLFAMIHLPDQVVAALSFMMSWPQVVTGCLGIILAKLLLQRLPHRQ